jgi:hypothetical protein
MATYADIMIDIKDDNLQSKIIQFNNKYFNQEMIQHLYNYLVTIGIYG